MVNKLLQRLRNKKVLVAIFSGVILILVNSGAIDLGMSDHITFLFNTILGVLIAAGVVSDPDSHLPE